MIESEKPIIAIHGLQGSGKTYLVNTIITMLLPSTEKYKYINIKSTFMALADLLTDQYKSMGYELNEAQRKQLLLGVSTFGEQHVDEMIWTKAWVRAASLTGDIVVVDDIRTEFNIRGLREISEIRPVILFKLDVPEEIRRRRLGPKWRDNGGYTEVLMKRPSDLPKNFQWIELTEDWTLSDIKKHLGEF